jgi:hypothetical protein
MFVLCCIKLTHIYFSTDCDIAFQAQRLDLIQLLLSPAHLKPNSYIGFVSYHYGDSNG